MRRSQSHHRILFTHNRAQEPLDFLTQLGCCALSHKHIHKRSRTLKHRHNMMMGETPHAYYTHTRWTGGNAISFIVCAAAVSSSSSQHQPTAEAAAQLFGSLCSTLVVTKPFYILYAHESLSRYMPRTRV